MKAKLNKKAANIFAKEVKNTLYGILTAWTNTCNCYYDSSDYAIRQFVFTAKHSFGTAYCNWTYHKSDMVSALRNAGATNIKANVEFNYVYITFDIKKAKYNSICEELGLIEKNVA